MAKSARVRNFLLLSRCLNRDTSAAKLARLRGDLCSPHVDWVDLILTANGHFVGPALYGSMERKGLLDCLPDEARGYLRDLHAMNTVRNEHLRRQALELVVGFNGAGITPILLKGAVSLFEPAFGDPGGRMMGDLDILLPAVGFEDGLAVLRAAGYRWNEEREKNSEGYCLPDMFRQGEVARVEIHWRLGSQQHVLSSESTFREAVEMDVGGAQALALCPTHAVIHNVLHANGQDHHHAVGFISLKEHWNLLALCERHGPEVDWDRIGRLMREHGLERVLSSYLFIASHLLGLEVTQVIRRPVRSRLHYLRCLAGLRWNFLAMATKFWVGVTYPFSRYCVDSRYGKSNGWVDVNVKRARNAWRILNKHEWKIIGTIKQKHQNFGNKLHKTDVWFKDPLH